MEPPATPATSRFPARRTAAGEDASWLLSRVAAGGGSPRLTWYADGGERVELSGAVLTNWTTKTANLLVEEFDAGAHSTITLDLPAHWRSVTWALAAWRVGAGIRLTARDTADEPIPDGAESAEVVVTDRPTAWAERADRGAPELVAVNLAPLARSFGAPLPPRAVDAAASVMTYGDALGYAPPTDPSATALSEPAGTSVTHDQLVAWGRGGPAGALPDGARTLVVARDPARFLRDAVGTWARDGSLVAVTPDVARLAATDPERWERVAAGERVEERLLR